MSEDLVEQTFLTLDSLIDKQILAEIQGITGLLESLQVFYSDTTNIKITSPAFEAALDSASLTISTLNAHLGFLKDKKQLSIRI